MLAEHWHHGSFWRRVAVLPFKASDSKLRFIFIPKHGKHKYFVKDNPSFSTVKQKFHLISASGLNLVKKELPLGSRIEKNNSGDQAVRSQSQVRPTSCIYTRTLMIAAKNKSDPLTPRLLGSMGWGQRWKRYGLGSSSLRYTARLQCEPCKY